MEPAAAKLIGAGLACIALAGAGVGIGTIFGAYLQGALATHRPPPDSLPICSSALPWQNSPAFWAL